MSILLSWFKRKLITSEWVARICNHSNRAISKPVHENVKGIEKNYKYVLTGLGSLGRRSLKFASRRALLLLGRYFGKVFRAVTTFKKSIPSVTLYRKSDNFSPDDFYNKLHKPKTSKKNTCSLRLEMHFLKSLWNLIKWFETVKIATY